MTNNNSFTFNSYGQDMVLTPEFARYSNGRLAVSILYRDEEMGGDFPFAKLTVNMPEIHLNEGEVLIKDWAENAPLVDFLVGTGDIIPTGREVSSGYVFPMVARLSGPLLPQD